MAEKEFSTGRKTETSPTGFGHFKVDLADNLKLDVVQKLCQLLELRPGVIDGIERADRPGHKIMELMEERAIISPTDISQLVSMLNKLKLTGLAVNIQTSFQEKTGWDPFYEAIPRRIASVQDRTGASSGAIVVCNIDPLDFPYVYRFACGIDKSASESIIQNLQKTGEGSRFALSDQLLLRVRDLVLRDTPITSYDTILLQRSTIQLLEVASANQMPISCVDLDGCSPRVDASGLNLILISGLSFPILSSLQKLRISDYDRSLTNEEFAAIVGYSSQCTSLKKLEFWYYNLPDTVPVRSIPSFMKSRNMKVSKYKYGDNHHLNLHTGQWRNDEHVHTSDVTTSDESTHVGGAEKKPKSPKECIIS